MKSIVTSFLVFVVAMCAAQDNKFQVGDFGIRYGVQFNGSAVQGLTFSGMVTSNIEVGCGVNVQYSASSVANNTAVEVQIYSNNAYSEAPGQQTASSHSRTLTGTVTPYVFYHFKIKNNLDIYAGPGLIVGTGAHTFISTASTVIQANNYYSDNFSKIVYPWGYQVGGGLSVGGQYFFYKRLALGVQATLGVSYSNSNGDQKSFLDITNSGSYNNHSPTNLTSAVFAPYVNHSLSVTTASSIGINLTFYLAQKAKKVKKAGTL
jgi:hypothetical protein